MLRIAYYFLLLYEIQFSNVWHTFIYKTNQITFYGKILVLVVFKIGRLIGHAFLQSTMSISAKIDSIILFYFNTLVCDSQCELCTLEDTCRHCDDFHYGPNCENICSSGCAHGSCDEVTGICSNCSVGYSGEQCQLKCKQKFSNLKPHLVDFPLLYFFRLLFHTETKK